MKTGSIKNRTKIVCLMTALALLASGCSIKITGVFPLPEVAEAEKNREEESSQEQEYIGPPPVISISDDTESIITEHEDEENIEYEELYDPVAKEYSVMAASPDQVTLSFVGDVGFAKGYATINKYRSNGEDIHKSIDDGVLSLMQSSDIMMANNEFPYSDRGTPTPNKTFTFRADPRDVHIMKDMGVDIVGLANNHAYDYGPDALIDTIDTLNDARLPFVGAGKNIDEAMQPAYFHVNGNVISIVAATQIERLGSPDTKEATADSPGVLRTLDPAKAVQAIKTASENSDFTVMFVHWGTESTDLVEKSQRDLAKAYVDAGADLVIGAHSHCLQGIDYIDDVPIFYSLGNFWFNSKTLDTCIVTATLNRDCKLDSVRFIPCIQRGSGVACASTAEHDRIIEYMRGISNYAEIDDDGFVTKSDKDHNTQNGQNTSPARKAPEPAEDAGDAPAQAEQTQPAQTQLEQDQAEQAQQPQEEKLPDWAVDTQ